MDPNATFAIVMDPSESIADRIEAVINLQEWLGRGGFAPDDLAGDDLDMTRQCAPDELLATIDGDDFDAEACASAMNAQ